MKLVVGNFKMNLNSFDIDEYIDYFREFNYPNAIFAPSSIYLDRFIENGFTVAAQDVSFGIKGAYTGDISSMQLKSLGVNYCIVGHSERRKYYEDDKFVHEKLVNILNEKIKPILCVGETKEERDANKTIDVIKNELAVAFDGIESDLINNVIIAYEPIWSIGTGVIPTNIDIDNVIKFIKDYIMEKYNAPVRVLYGGSVNNECIDELEKLDNVDGYLVGGCSIKKEEFNKLIKRVG